MNKQKRAGTTSPKAGIFAGVSIFSGLGALAAKSCCILPFLLASSGIGGAWLSHELAPFRPYFLIAAIASLVIGWILVIRRNKITCHMDGFCSTGKTGWFTIGMLGLASVLVVVTALWDRFQPAILDLLKSIT